MTDTAGHAGAGADRVTAESTPEREHSTQSNRSPGRMPRDSATGGGIQTWKHPLHVLVLASLSLAQPIFDLLSQYPQFLVAHHAGLVEVSLLVFLLTFLIPGSVVAAEYMLGLVIGTKGWLQGVGIAVFAFPLYLLFLKGLKGIPGAFLVGTAVLLTWLSILAYRRYRPVHLFLTILSPAILIIPILFLTRPSIQGIIAPGKPEGIALESGKTDIPIVMVVFDELPLQSLLDRSGNIDSVRFPNLADLANRAAWFRNTTTVSENTQYAVPAMLTGNHPKTDHSMLPTLADYPDNLFTWLRNSHRLNVFESPTQLCLRCQESEQSYLQRALPIVEDLSVVYFHLVLPDNVTTRLPDIRHAWTRFSLYGRGHKWRSDNPLHLFESFLEAFRNEGKPSLNFIHVQIPHVPWVYLPSGRRYLSSGDMKLFMKMKIWVRDETLVTLAFQRHLLQVGLADRLVGQLLQKLTATRLYDRSLIIIVSDHGASFRPGRRRRGLTETNFEEILSVPLLIKTPYQRQGRVSDRRTRTTDIFPSIPEILGVPVPWPTDGIPVTDTSKRREKDLASSVFRTFPPSNFLLHRTTVCLEGTTFKVTRQRASAHLDVVGDRGDKVLFFGWAADMETLKPADSILVFVNNELIHKGTTGYPRPGVAKHHEAAELKNSGFYFELGRELFKGNPQVRCFAHFGDRITEVSYPMSFPWPIQSNGREETRSSALDQTCSIGQEAPRSYLITRSVSPETLMETSRPNDFVIGLRELAWDADENGLFKIGPSVSLVGKPLNRVHVTEQRGLHIELDEPRLYKEVDLDASFIPAAIEGWISAKNVIEFVAIAVNGTLRVVTPTFDGPEGRRRFQAIVPEESFLSGSNQVQAFAVTERNGKAMLHSPPHSR